LSPVTISRAIIMQAWKRLVGQHARGMASVAASADNVLIAPSARILLASNPSLTAASLAKTVKGRMPKGSTIITKVGCYASKDFCFNASTPTDYVSAMQADVLEALKASPGGSAKASSPHPPQAAAPSSAPSQSPAPSNSTCHLHGHLRIQCL
jgi:hypothetical protein